MENIIERPKKNNTIVITGIGDLTNEKYVSIYFVDDIIDSKYRCGGVPRKCFINKRYYDSKIFTSELCFKPLLAIEEFYKNKNGQLVPTIVSIANEEGETLWATNN